MGAYSDIMRTLAEFSPLAFCKASELGFGWAIEVSGGNGVLVDAINRQLAT